MEITGREVWAIGWMVIKRLPAELLQEILIVEPCVAIDLAQLTMNFHRLYALYIQKLYHRPHCRVGGSRNKSLHLQPLQQCYYKNLGSPASACVMRRHYSITYTQSLDAINCLIAEGRVGNLLCGRPSLTSSGCSIYFHLYFIVPFIVLSSVPASAINFDTEFKEKNSILDRDLNPGL